MAFCLYTYPAGEVLFWSTSGVPYEGVLGTVVIVVQPLQKLHDRVVVVTYGVINWFPGLPLPAGV